MDQIADRFASVREKIAAAAAAAGRSPSEIELVAVSKTHPPETIRRAFEEAGQTVFGESRLQEARAKQPQLPGRLHWHFIGHLQKNKIRAALPHFELFHGVDSMETARQIQRIAGEEGLRPAVLLEINLAREASKFGFPVETIEAQLEEILSFDRLALEGLMCIPPPGPTPEDSRHHFIQLRELRDRLQTEARVGLPHLSMGMSNDYEVAVQEGATLVRVGTALFGERARAGD
jgi:PLP dependent protein